MPMILTTSGERSHLQGYFLSGGAWLQESQLSSLSCAELQRPQNSQKEAGTPGRMRSTYMPAAPRTLGAEGRPRARCAACCRAQNAPT